MADALDHFVFSHVPIDGVGPASSVSNAMTSADTFFVVSWKVFVGGWTDRYVRRQIRVWGFCLTQRSETQSKA